MAGGGEADDDEVVDPGRGAAPGAEAVGVIDDVDEAADGGAAPELGDGAATPVAGDGADDEQDEPDDQQPAEGFDGQTDTAEEEGDKEQEDHHASSHTHGARAAVAADPAAEDPPAPPDAAVASGDVPAAVDAPPEPRLFVAGETGVEVAGPAPDGAADGVLAEVEATLATPAAVAVTIDESAAGGRRRWIIGGVAAAIGVLAVTAVAVALPRASDEPQRPPLSAAPEPTTTTTAAPEPRPAIAADVDACPSLTAGVVPGHLVVTDLLASTNRDGRYVGILTGESRPRDMAAVAAFTFVAVLGEPPPPPPPDGAPAPPSTTATTSTEPRPEHDIDAAGTTQLWVRWNGTALETAVRRRSLTRWVTEPAPDLRVEMNAGRIVRWYWPGLVPGMPFATVAAGGGQCQAAGLDPATLQPLPGIAAVK